MKNKLRCQVGKLYSIFLRQEKIEDEEKINKHKKILSETSIEYYV